jgi:hypothetical protein
MSKKLSNHSKLSFFEQSTMDDLEYSINKVIYALDEGKITTDSALELLHVASCENHRIFWRLASKIHEIKGFARCWDNYTHVSGHAPGVTLRTGSPTTKTLVDSFNACANQRITLDEFKKTADACHHSIRGELKSVLNEINAMVRKLKNRHRDKVVQLSDQEINYSFTDEPAQADHNDDMAGMRVRIVNSAGRNIGI